MSKKCTKCQSIKELSEFHNLKSSKDGKKGTCKVCIKEESTSYYSTNKDSILAKKDRELEKERSAQYYKDNKSTVLKKASVKYSLNSDAIKEYQKEYYNSNKKEILPKQNERKREKRANDPLFRMACNVRRRILEAVNGGGFTKNGSSQDILGIDYKGLLDYLESKMTEGMTIGKLGKEIHIDHIIPLASATTEEEILRLCHHSNLQPLWAKDNLSKGCKY